MAGVADEVAVARKHFKIPEGGEMTQHVIIVKRFDTMVEYTHGCVAAKSEAARAFKRFKPELVGRRCSKQAQR